MVIDEIVQSAQRIITNYHLDYGHAAITMTGNTVEVVVEAPHGALWVGICFSKDDLASVERYRSAINIKHDISESLTYFNAEEYLFEETNGQPESEPASRLSDLITDAEYFAKVATQLVAQEA